MSETLTFSFFFAGADNSPISITIPLRGLNNETANDTITFNGVSQPASTTPTANMTNTSGVDTLLTVVVEMQDGYYNELSGWTGEAQSRLRTVVASNDTASTTWGLGMNGVEPGLLDLTDGFEGCGGLTTVPEYLPYSVTNLRSCFQNASQFNSDIKAWNIERVTTLVGTFSGATAFNSDIGLWDTANVSSMNATFLNASSFNQNIRIWNTLGVSNYINIFSGATQMIAKYSTYPGFGPPTTQNFFNQEQLVITWTNVPDGGSVSIPLSSIVSPLDPDIDVIRWNEGQAVSIASSLFYANTTGSALTFTARITVQSGGYGHLGGTWANGIYLTSIDVTAPSNIQPTTTWAIGVSGANPSLTDLSSGFVNLPNLVSVPIYLPVTITTLQSAFFNATSFNAPLNDWDTTNVVNMSGTFYNATSFNQPIGNWMVDNVTDYSEMFRNAVLFNQPIGVGTNWDTLSAYNFNSMFKDATNFNQDISNWVTNAVTDFSYMFQNASRFNKPIGVGTVWNTNFVTNMIGMFNNAEDFNQDIGNWNTGIVTDMTSMFDGAISFNSDIGNWNTINVTTMVKMFHNTDSYNNGIDVDVISDWNVSNVTDMTSMFENALSFNRDIRNWNTGNVTTMVNMFKRALAFNTYIGIWNTSNVTDMTGMFQHATLFDQYINYNGIYWNVSNVTTMKNMFYGAGSFNQELKDWIVSNVTDMSGMFQEAGVFNKNIGVGSNWDVSNVTTMKNMFHDALRFNQNLNNWNLLSVLDMASMFEGATDFNGLITYWTTPNVTDMSSMFSGASNFNQDIGNWKTQNVTSMYEMFKDAVVFDQYIRSWVTIKVNDYTRMFLGATAMIASYTGTTGFGITPTADFFNQRFPCFLGGTLIETNKGMVPVEELRQGDMVKTIDDGYKPVEVIGTRMIPHFAMDERVKDQLYICRKERFPEATDDLIITGCHSLLLFRDFHDNNERERVIQVNGKAYVTNGILRFPACVLDRNGMYTTDVYPVKGTYNIYHFALEHEDYYMNYGIYANNILVESSSRRYMYEESNMYLIDYKVPEEQEEPTYIDTLEYENTKELTNKECNDIIIQT